MSDRYLRPAPVAAGTALLGTIGFVAAALVFVTIPENPPGDGFEAGLAGIFVLLYAVAGALALAEAGTLYLVAGLSTSTDRVRRLLLAGAVVGGLAVALLAAPTLAHRLFVVVLGRPVLMGGDALIGVGLSLVPVGVACTGIGVVLHAADVVRS